MFKVKSNRTLFVNIFSTGELRTIGQNDPGEINRLQ